MAANILVKQVVILAAAALLLHTFDRLIHEQARRELTAAANQVAQSFRPSDWPVKSPLRPFQICALPSRSRGVTGKSIILESHF